MMIAAVDGENSGYTQSDTNEVPIDVANESNEFTLLTSEANSDFNTDPIFDETSNVDENAVDRDNIHGNNILDGEDDINSMKLCSNCLNDFNPKNDKCFENDECGHILCVKCRFVQDNICKLCKIKQQEELESSVALDLTTGYSSNSNDQKPCNFNKSSPVKTKRKWKYFPIPDYIAVLSRDPPEYQCTICKRKFHYKLQAKYHEACSTGQRPLKCDVCDKTFIKKSHLEYHIRTHSGVKPFICNICDKSFIQKNKLTRHIKIHSGQREVFKCKKCNVCLLSKQRFEIHIRTHTNERPFHCKKCQRTFRDKYNLTVHEIFKHSDGKNFICEDCGKVFKIKTDLVRHKRIFHFGYKQHSCNVDGCSSRFAFRRDLFRHMQSHSTDQEYDYECSICMTGFRRKDNLERHMKNSHPESVTALGKPRQIVTVVRVKDLPVMDDSTELKKDTSDQTGNSEGAAIDKCVSSATLKKSTVKKIGLSANELSSNIRKTRTVDIKNNSKKTKKSISKLNIPRASCTKVTNCDNENRESLLNINKRTGVVKENEKEDLYSLTVKLFDSLSTSNITGSSAEEKPVAVAEKETLPKFQKVSVISSSKKYLNEEKKLTKSNLSNCRNSSKKADTIAPFRLITPSLKSASVDGGNCVPTITKVMHIVHTSHTGVSNIKTVITTRGVTEKSKVDKSKSKNSINNKYIGMSKGNLNSSVIKYVPKSTKNTPLMKHKCYRVLGESSSSSIFTYNCSYNKNNIVNNGVSMMQESVNNIRSNALQSETNVSVRNVQDDITNSNDSLNNYDNHVDGNYNIFFNNTPKLFDYSLGSNVLSNFGNNSCNETEDPIGQDQNKNLHNLNKISLGPSTSVSFNSNQIIQPFSSSESCLLANNALDESLTDSLYIDNENSNNNDHDFNNSIVKHCQLGGSNVTEVLSPDFSNPSSKDYLNINFINNKQLCDNPSKLSSDIDGYVYEGPKDGLRSFNGVDCSVISETNEQLITNNSLHQSPPSYFFDNSYADTVSNSIENVNFDDCSENIHQSCVSNEPNSSLNVNKPRNNFESNGLFTLADMACERANLLDKVGYIIK